MLMGYPIILRRLGKGQIVSHIPVVDNGELTFHPNVIENGESPEYFIDE